MGTRKAEPSYDLFAVAMIMINMCYPKRFERKENGREQLRLMISSHPYLKHMKNIMACTRWKVYLRLRNEKRVIAMYATTVYADRKKQGERVVHVKERKISLGRDDVLFVCVLFMYVVYLYVQIL